MTSMKTWCLLFLAAILPTVPTLAEVAGSVADCDQFLLDETPPQVPGILEGGNILNQNRYKPICQTFRNERRFVTLYDVENKIPVFSAYKYRGDGGGKRPPNHWKIEPQLEEGGDKNMSDGDKHDTYANQAGDTDYRNNGGFDRGHLIPSSYAFTRTDRMSTFTLTNIVPQAKTFNQGSWNRMEKCIKCVMDEYCINNNNVTEGFVVAGAKPSTNVLKHRINIPSMLWSAFCCYSAKVKMWLASSHWSDNVPDASKNKYLQTKTLAELHQELKIADSEFNVFPETQCPTATTVTAFYPKFKNCHCLPSISTISGPLPSTPGPSTPGPLPSTPGPSTPGPLPSTPGPSTPGPLPSTPGPSTPGPLPSTPGPSTPGPLPSTPGPSTPGPLPSTPGPGPLPSTPGPGPLPSTPGPGPLPSTPGPGPLPSTPGPGPLPSTPGPGPLPSTPGPGPLPSTPGPGPLPSTPGPGPLPSTPGPGPLPSTPGPLPSTSGPAITTRGLFPATSAHATSTSSPPAFTSGPPTTTPGLLASTTSSPSTARSAPAPFTSGSHTITSGPVTTPSDVATPASGPATSSPPTSGY